jgi:hypothetical protein
MAVSSVGATHSAPPKPQPPRSTQLHPHTTPPMKSLTGQDQNQPKSLLEKTGRQVNKLI